jgi:hypothetical protein
MGSVDDLIAFYRARLNEDEQTALDWQRHKQALTEQFMNDPRRKHVRLRREPVTDAQVVEYAYHDRFDPARVLRRVEAGRKLIELCARQWRDDLRGSDTGLEIDALELAVYEWADHDDYQEKWRP